MQLTNTYLGSDIILPTYCNDNSSMRQFTSIIWENYYQRSILHKQITFLQAIFFLAALNRDI